MSKEERVVLHASQGPNIMRKACFLVMCVIMVRGDTGGMMARTETRAALQNLLSNHVMSEISEAQPLEDFTIMVDERSVMHLSHLRLILSLNSHNLQVDPNFNSSIIHFSCAGGFANFIGNFKLKNSTSFVSKGVLNVSLTSLDVTGAADLLLDEKCISVHDCIVKFEPRGSDVKFLHKNENGVAEMKNINVSTFLVSFKELVSNEVIQALKRQIIDTLNSALCSAPIKTLIGEEEEEHAYRKIALKPVPYFNEIVDTILENLKPLIHKLGYDSIHLPDVNTTFTKKESIFKLQGTLQAEDGSLGNLTSVRRSSDCVLAGNGSFFLVSGGFEMDAFTVTYEKIDATFEDIEFTGKISISFKVISIYFRATMEVINSTCYPSLSYIHVNKLDNIHVEVEGNKSWVVKQMILLAFDRYKNKIVVTVDSLFEKLGKKYLKSFDCSNYFGITSSYFMPHSRTYTD